MRSDKSLRVLVTAAVITRRGKVLIARRKRGARFGGLWEFPGGKVERGESPEEGLRRELGEELGVSVRLDGLFCRSRLRRGERTVILATYKARLVSGRPEALDHEELRWVEPAELNDFEFPELDKPVIARLLTARKPGRRVGRVRKVPGGKRPVHGKP